MPVNPTLEYRKGIQEALKSIITTPINMLFKLIEKIINEISAIDSFISEKKSLLINESNVVRIKEDIVKLLVTENYLDSFKKLKNIN